MCVKLLTSCLSCWFKYIHLSPVRTVDDWHEWPVCLFLLGKGCGQNKAEQRHSCFKHLTRIYHLMMLLLCPLLSKAGQKNLKDCFKRSFKLLHHHLLFSPSLMPSVIPFITLKLDIPCGLRCFHPDVIGRSGNPHELSPTLRGCQTDCHSH